MSKSNFYESEILNATYRGQTTFLGAALTGKLANVFISLHSADPGEDGSGAEFAGGGYARVAVPCSNASWTAPADNAGAMQITNDIDIVFAESTGNQGNAAYFATWTASLGGNVLHKGALAIARNVNAAGITIRIPDGQLAISEG